MTKGNEPAFPTQMWDIEEKEATWLDGGLSKREIFAAMAMQGMMTLEPPDMLRWSGSGKEEFQTVAEWVASNAVAMADALLAELEKGTAPLT